MSNINNELASQILNPLAQTEEGRALIAKGTEVAEKAELIDFQCVLMTAPELLKWWDGVPMLHDDPQDAAQALENIKSLYERAKADGVYPVKTKA